MSNILISGSISYDTLLRVDDDIRAALGLIDDGNLSVGYHCKSLERTFGGPAANMAFHLANMGIHACPIAAVGSDFGPYADWLTRNGVNQSLLRIVESELTAQAFIISDREHNQFIAFYPGAMRHSKSITLSMTNAELAVVGPDDREALLQRLTDFHRIGTRILFDPGQCITSLTPGDLTNALSQSHWMIVNEFERGLVERMLGTEIESLTTVLEAVVVTRGSKGLRLYQRTGVVEIDALPVPAPLDPTGCGDALRAGMICGILSGISMPDALQSGTRLAAETMAHIGAQWQSVPLTS
jgi:adenosine kinase